VVSHAEGFDVFTFHYIHMKRAHQIVSLSESCNGDVVVDFAVEHHARKNPRLASCIAELIEIKDRYAAETSPSRDSHAQAVNVFFSLHPYEKNTINLLAFQNRWTETR
jgi:hypothetical protein